MGKRVFLSLGSNQGNRVANLQWALGRLPGAGVRVERISSFYRTEPVDFLPQAWFINCVAEAETDLMPLQLLSAVETIEREIGRRAGPRFGPRRLDIDILFYENVIVRLTKLTIPHPRLPERRFVLIPLAELAPRLRHPGSQRTVLEMLAETPDTSQVIRLKETVHPCEEQ